MYAKYVSNPTSVQAQVIADLAALLSGASVASLSASCDKANTSLVNTVAPGWTLVDTTAPSSGHIVTASDLDGLTVKAARLYAGNTTQISLTGSEGWNSTTHLGSNTTNAVAFLAYSATSVNAYTLFATPRSFLIARANGDCMGAFEFGRECEYLKGTSYPCFAIVTSTSLSGQNDVAYAPRIKTLTAAGDLTGVNSGVWAATIASKYVGYGSNAKAPSAILDGANNAYYEMRPLWAALTVNTYAAILGKFYDVLEIGQGAASNFETYTKGADTYVILNAGPSTFAFKLA